MIPERKKKEEENETCHKKIIKLWLFIRQITRRRKFCRALLWKKIYKKNCAIFERKSEICNSINFFLFEKKFRWRAYFCWKVKLRLRADKKRVVGICFDYSLSPHFANPKKHHEIFFIIIDCCFYLTKKNKRKCQMCVKLIYGVNYPPPMNQFYLFFKLLPFIYKNWPTTPAHYHNI